MPITDVQHLTERLKREPIFPVLLALKKKFPAARAYLVGGAVRDLLLDRQTTDFDFVVRKVKPEALKKFLASQGSVSLVGKTFGVFKFLPKGAKEFLPYDIALPRTEHSLNFTGGRRDFNVQSDPDLPMEEDVKRRDFTINAMAIDVFAGTLIDPTGGIADLAEERIRAVGDIGLRFLEDYTRVLRAIRFACELGFEIEPQTWRELKIAMPELAGPTVPRELVAKEFVKAFAANPTKAFDFYDMSGGFRALMPEVLMMRGTPQAPEIHSEGDVFEHTRLALESFDAPQFTRAFPGERPSAQVIIATLLHDVGKPSTTKTPEHDGTDRIRADRHADVGADIAKSIVERLKLSSYLGLVDANKLHWLVKHHLVLLHGAAKQMRPSTIEYFFFRDPDLGRDLRMLLWVDSAATLRPGRERFTSESYDALVDRVKKMGAKGNQLPKPLVSGGEMMKALKLKPGPQVGKLLMDVREAQLSGKVKTKAQALALVKKVIHN